MLAESIYVYNSYYSAVWGKAGAAMNLMTVLNL
jgi:hypothetical protein